MAIQAKDNFNGTGGTNLVGRTATLGGVWVIQPGGTASSPILAPAGSATRIRGIATAEAWYQFGTSAASDNYRAAFCFQIMTASQTLEIGLDISQVTVFSGYKFRMTSLTAFQLRRYVPSANTTIATITTPSFNVGDFVFGYVEIVTSGATRVFNIRINGVLYGPYTDTTPLPIGPSTRKVGVVNAPVTSADDTHIHVAGEAIMDTTGMAIAFTPDTVVAGSTTAVAVAGTNTLFDTIGTGFSTTAGTVTNPAHSGTSETVASFDFTPTAVAQVITITDWATGATGTITVTLPTLNAPVIDPITSLTNSTATIDWSVATGGIAPITHELFRDVFSPPTTDRGDVSASPIIDTGLSASTLYYWQIKATDAAGQTALSNIEGATTDAPPAATGITIDGPAAGVVGEDLTYTVAVTPVGGTVTGTVRVTPVPANGIGAVPAYADLTTANQDDPIVITPTLAGVYVVTLTNNGSLTNPAGVTLTVTEEPHVDYFAIPLGSNAATTGVPPYVVWIADRHGRFWNVATAAWEAYNVANNYEIAATLSHNGRYHFTIPANARNLVTSADVFGTSGAVYVGTILVQFLLSVDETDISAALVTYDVPNRTDLDDIGVDPADIQAAMTAQGYTAARAALMDHLDADVSSAGGSIGTGDGDTAIDHDFGGVDALRLMQSGSGVDGAFIRAYLTSEYDASTYTLRGWTRTASDGRWVSPLMLNSGLDYTIEFRDTVSVVTVEVSLP